MILGIDLSLTSTGIAFGLQPQYHTVRAITSKAAGKCPVARTHRHRMLVCEILNEIGDEIPEAIIIEGYSHGSMGCATTDLAELRGILVSNLITRFSPHYVPIYEVAPSTLKKFVIGKGTGGKDLIRLNAFKRWKVEFETDDEVDAYGLWRLGLCLVGRDMTTCKAQEEAVDTVRNGPKPKKPRKKKVST